MSKNIAALRNVGIIAHIDAGKTTLTERMLFYTSKIHRMGEVHDGNATMDFMPEEQERGITIAAAATTCEWQRHTINIIDTPGHVDFTIEVERSLRVLDGAVGVFCAVGGVEPQSETVWRQSEHFQVPKLAFINKMDRMGADFKAVLSAMRQRLHAVPVPLTIPLGEGEDFQALADVITLERLDFDQASQGREYSRSPLSGSELEQAAAWQDEMHNTLADADELFFEQYLSGTFSPDDVRAALRRATLARRLVPVFAGSALRNYGVQPLLDGVTLYLPSPLDCLPAQAHSQDGQPLAVPPDPKAPAAALVFKVMLEGGRKTAMLRVYSGVIKDGDTLCRVTDKKEMERVSRMFRLHADRQEQTAEAGTGEIVAVLGLRAARTGDTYTAPERPLLLERINDYAGVLSLAFEPRNADEGKALDEALERFCLEDPTLNVTLDEGSGHRIVSGMGELHLEVLGERIRREYNISPRTGQPQVLLRESIAATADAIGLFDRDLGNVHHYGEVSVHVTPRPRGEGNLVLLSLPEPEKNNAVPKAFIDAALEGISDTLLSGPQGYPVQDVEVRLFALDRTPETTAPGCHMAAASATRQALQAAGSLALEPIMFVEISVPDDFLGSAISLFNSRGGKVENLFDRAGLKIMQGRAPLRQLFGFSTALRSGTQGRAGLMQKFETFDAV